MSASIDRLLAIAAGQIGGYYPGKSPYGEWYGRRVGDYGTYAAAQYCAMFVSWCADQAGLLGTVIPLHAYTPSGASWFRAKGRFTPGVKGIRRGDIWYSSCSGLGRISHVGIVERVYSDGSFDTIEGNTSVTAAGSQNNGRRVARKRRNTACSLGGYGRPAYPATAPTAPPASAALPAATAWDLAAQKKLRACGLYSGDLDGRRGPMQKSSTATYQRRQNTGGGKASLLVDGDFGAKTNAWYDWVHDSAQPCLNKYQGVAGKVVIDGDYYVKFGAQVGIVQRRNGLVKDDNLGPIMIAWMRSAKGGRSPIRDRP